MFVVEYVNTSEPVMNMLKSGASELFEKPFAGYAVFLFGDSDEGVARWFAESVVSLDSLTGADIACVIFAKAITTRGTIKKHFTPRPPGSRGAQQDGSGAYHLDSISREYRYRPLVEDWTSTWDPSEQDIRVVTYEVDRIAADLSVTRYLPCLLFFDALPSEQKDLASIREHGTAVLPLHDNPGKDVIRLLRKVVHRFRAGNDLNSYISNLEEIMTLERNLRSHQWEHIQPLESKISSCRLAIQRLAAGKVAFRVAAAGASVKGLRRILANNPEIDPECLVRLVGELDGAKEELAALNRTVRTLEFYGTIEPWPLTETSLQRLTDVVALYVVRWIPDVLSEPVVISAMFCAELVDILAKRQAHIVESVLISDRYDLDAAIQNAINRYESDINTTEALLALRIGDRKRIESRLTEVKAYCNSPQSPSIVREVAAQLLDDREEKKAEGEGSGSSLLSVLFIQNTHVGDSYIIGQAGAVGPGATASNMVFNPDLLRS